MPTYRRRRSRRYSISKWTRGFLIGLIFLGVSAFVASAVTYLISVLPDSYIVISNGTISVSSTAGTSGGLSTKLVLGLLGWSASILMFIQALRRLKVNL